MRDQLPICEWELERGTEVLLIRHGETDWNREHRVQGHLDVALSPRGLEQARRLAHWLAEESIAGCYASDLQRARVTAELLAGERIPLRVEPRFREAGFGTWEGLTTQEIADRFPEDYRAWRADALRHRPAGGETLEDLWARCEAALREHLPRHNGERIAVVAHGGPIRVMTCALMGWPLAAYPRLRVENTGVTRIAFNGRGSVLAGFNETAHLRGTRTVGDNPIWEEK